MAIVLVFLAGCSGKKYADAMANGEAALEEEKYEEAVEYFEEALEYADNRSDANNYIYQIEEIQEYMRDLKHTYTYVNQLKDDKDYIAAKDEIEGYSYQEISSNSVEKLENKLEALLEEIEEEEKEFVASLEATLAEAKELGESKKYLKGQELIQETLDKYSDYMDEKLQNDLNDLEKQLGDARKANAEVPINMVTDQEELKGTYVKAAGFIQDIIEAEDGTIERILLQSFRDPDSSDRSPHNLNREYTSIEFPKGEFYPGEFSHGFLEIYLYGYVQGTYSYTTVRKQDKEVGNIILDEIEYIELVE